MPQETKAKFDATRPDAEVKAAQGLTVTDEDPQHLRAAIDAAFDYRGDVTVRRRSTDQAVEGFIFDRRERGDLAQSELRMMPKRPAEGQPARLRISYADVAAIEFTGRDAAAGKSFETWMKKYVEKKLKGEEASIHSESLGNE